LALRCRQALRLHGLLLANRIVILTGGVGCGKSAAASEFEALGVSVVDADTLSHELTKPQGLAMNAIAQAFGKTMLTPDGGLNRAAMRAEVFRNPESRARLEAILHPMIQESARAALAQASSPYAVYVVPLWFERYGPQAGGQASPGIAPIAIVAVDCAEETQLERVMRRSGLSQNEVQAIMSTQVPRQKRLLLADHVIDNQGPKEKLKEHVAALHRIFANP
jgi:dephospho-CoA kinase